MDAKKILDTAHRQTYHEQDERIFINTYQDVEPHMEYAAKCRRVDAEERGAFGKRGDMHRTMAVPFNVILAVAQRLGIAQGKIFESDHMKRIVKELKGPEFTAFRTTIDKRI